MNNYRSYVAKYSGKYPEKTLKLEKEDVK